MRIHSYFETTHPLPQVAVLVETTEADESHEPDYPWQVVFTHPDAITRWEWDGFGFVYTGTQTAAYDLVLFAIDEEDAEGLAVSSLLADDGGWN